MLVRLILLSFAKGSSVGAAETVNDRTKTTCWKIGGGAMTSNLVAKSSRWRSKWRDILPPCARICQLDGKGIAQIRYLGFLTCEEMSFRKLFLERSSPLTRLALASIFGPFLVYLLKFTLLTPFLHTFSSLSHPGSLIHYLGLLEFPVRICDALHITTHTRRA